MASLKITFSAVLGGASILGSRVTQGCFDGQVAEVAPEQSAVSIKFSNLVGSFFLLRDFLDLLFFALG